MNIQQHTIRMIVAIASISDFKLWFEDVLQAYLQSSSELTREVNIKPKHGFNLLPQQVLNVFKSPYGYFDSEDYCHLTMNNHLQKDLNMKRMSDDLACFYEKTQRELSGLIGTYVDNTIVTSNNKFI